jgi:hypothetical protein
MDLLSRVIRLINSDGLDRFVLSHGAIVALAVTPAMGWQDLLDGEFSSISVVTPAVKRASKQAKRRLHRVTVDRAVGQ